MAEYLPPVPGERRDFRWLGRRRGLHSHFRMDALHLCISLLPATIMAVLGAVTAACLRTGSPSAATTSLVLAAS
ncbi:hypothetical protein ACFQ07_31455, partial [Actinomadura adrarensis]